MKYSIVVFVLFIVFGVHVFAQDKITVEDVIRETSKGSLPGFLITIPGAELKDVQNSWEKSIRNSSVGDIFKKSDQKVQFDKKGDESIARNAKIESISTNPVSVITTIVAVEGGVRFIAFIELDSVYLSKENSKEETYLATVNYVRNFGISMYKVVVENEQKDEESKLKDLESDLDKLKSKKEKLEKNIGNEESDIRENEAKIKTNSIDQEKQNQRVSTAKDALYTVDKKSEAYKEFKSKLRDEEKQLSRLVGDNKSYHGNIKESQIAISRAKDDIVANGKEQNTQIGLIEKQRAIIDSVKTKLENIK